MAADGSDDALLRSQTFLLTEQDFIETIVPEDELIISRTDLQGKITYANETFAQISGYTIDELIGKTHSIVRHPDMPDSIFKDFCIGK